MRKLILSSPGFPSGRVELLPEQLPIILGRSRRAGLTIKDDLLSRQHSEIRFNELGRFVIHDLESTNLTIVNGNDITSHELHTGDLILLGETEVRVEVIAPVDDPNEKTTRELNVMPESDLET